MGTQKGAGPRVGTPKGGEGTKGGRPEGIGGPEGGAQKGGAQKGGAPEFRAFVFPFPAPFSFFYSLLEGIFVELWPRVPALDLWGHFV